MTQDGAIYQRLEYDTQIRLLQVSRELKENRVECHLQTVDLRKADYVVLSYRWGASSASYEIILDGYLFKVRANLWGFLNTIRAQPGMLLWIDAICIDQRDIQERNQQVGIMGDIFRSATMVLSWLGTPSDATPSGGSIDLAFDLMSQVWSTSAQQANADMEVISDDLPLVRPGVTTDELWRSIAALCDLPYWGRVWVVQEILLSSNNYLLHGYRELPWQAFANFISLVDVRFQCPPQYARQILSSTAKSYAMSKPYATVPQDLQWRIGNALKHDYGRNWDVKEYSLFRILTMFGDRDCSDALDHVYALLSLTEEGQKFPIKYGVESLDLLLTVIHFCGASALIDANKQHAVAFRPTSQRAFMRNIRYLAETMELTQAYQKTQAYFHGTAPGNRGPSPRSDPCFPAADQAILLSCTEIKLGNEPPILKSNTLRRSMEAFTYDTLLHVDESASWLMCRNERQEQELELALVAVITMKDTPQARGFRILEPGRLRSASIVAVADGTESKHWEFAIPVDAHRDLVQAVILGTQPEPMKS